MTEKKKPDGIDQALANVQSVIGSIGKDAEGQAGQGRYKYASLSSIHETLVPLLTDANLYTRHETETSDDGQLYCVTYVTHAPSGESHSVRLPLFCSGEMRALGSSISYGRRYCLLMLFDLTTEDDDGASAGSQAPRPSAPQREAHAPAQKLERVDIGTDEEQPYVTVAGKVPPQPTWHAWHADTIASNTSAMSGKAWSEIMAGTYKGGRYKWCRALAYLEGVGGETQARALQCLYAMEQKHRGSGDEEAPF